MTKLLYLSDTYKFSETATVLKIEESEKGVVIILDQTIFYPQGGGQPADYGEILMDKDIFKVTDVRLSPEGKVFHYGSFQNNTFNENDLVQLEIDSERRLLHARVHSAGHLIDIAVKKSNFANIIPTKGYHFSDGPYVQYDGLLEDPQKFCEIVEKISNELIQSNIKIISIDLDFEEAKKRNVWAPKGKSARFVYFEGYRTDGCGCGGTHINTSQEIGTIKIRSIKSKKGITKIKYQIF